MSLVRSADEVRDEALAYPVDRSEVAFAPDRVIAVHTDVVRMPHGTTATRDVVVHPGAVGVVALDDDDRVLLLRQYRHPVRRMLWEPPAGLLDQSGEPPLDAARRELFEEAGVRAGQWWVLVDAFTSPGMSDEAVRVYLARDLTVTPHERPEGDHEERDMPLAWVPLDDAVERIAAGELHNPLCLMGVLAAVAARARGWSGLRPADAPWPERPVSGEKA